MQQEEVIIVGAGPCGLACAIALQNIGINPLVIEKGNVVNALYNFPTHQTFYSSSDKLEIGGVPFVNENRKPTRIQALAYYREVVKRKQVRVNAFEEVYSVEKTDGGFLIRTSKGDYWTKYAVIATGYYDHPNLLNIPGEDLPKVTHYFKEAHPFYNMDVAVIGGKNSSVDAALELAKVGARVTVLYRGSSYSDHIKPWVLPEFLSQVRSGAIRMVFNAHVKEITETEVIYLEGEELKRIPNDFVFAMTGYHPDHSFLQKMGVNIDNETGRPIYNPETMESNVEGIFIAGVLAAGNNANEIFIENGRFHGDLIASAIQLKEKSLSKL